MWARKPGCRPWDAEVDEYPDEVGQALKVSLDVPNVRKLGKSGRRHPGASHRPADRTCAPIDFDLDVVRAGVRLEVNAEPERLDLDDAACRRASSLGAVFDVSTDAHSITQLRFRRWGIDQARARRWVEVERVANACPLARILLWRRRAR